VRRQDAKALGCVALLIGGALSVFIPIFLIGAEIYSTAVWVVLMPGWLIFRPGAHDGAEILLATIFDALVFAAIIYAIVYAVASIIQRGRNA
jgi:hypothetical protein